MKKTMLRKISKANFDSKALNEMVAYLKSLLEKEYATDDEWFETVCEIVQFSETNGDINFYLLDTNEVPSDIRVDYCHIPTYLAAAILMRAFLHNKDLLTGKEDVILKKALLESTVRGLCGHGYEATRYQIDAMNLFIQAGVKEFLREYPDLCPEFTEMINGIVNSYRTSIKKGECFSDWNVDFRKEFSEIVEVFYPSSEQTLIFVYGTLLKGRSNYENFLAPEEPIFRGEIEGFDMYELGGFPGIVHGKGVVKGEVYSVTPEQLRRINSLEGEGYLYNKELVSVNGYDGDYEDAYVYVYNHSVADCDLIPYEAQPYKNEYIWYVSYGSNMLYDRFEKYICGGYCQQNGKEYAPCDDDTMPTEWRMVDIPYNMYFSNYNMGSWENSAVSFLDVNKFGGAIGRAYLIKESQLNHIHRSEGMGSNWYPDLVELESIDGIKAVTFTNKNTKQKEPLSKVSAEYYSTLMLGLSETCPYMSVSEIEEYLRLSADLI